MANQDWGFGFQAAYGPNGTAPNIIRMPVESGYATHIYKGTPVMMNTTQNGVDVSADGAGADLIGVAAEHFHPSGTQTDIAVWTLDHVFVAQMDGADITTIADYFGMFFDMTGQNGGNSITGISTGEIDSSSGNAASANLALKVLGPANNIGNKDLDATTGAGHTHFLCKFVNRFDTTDAFS